MGITQSGETLQESSVRLRPSHYSASQRTCRVQHIEIIGGSTNLPPLKAHPRHKSPSAAAAPDRTAPTPKLPVELRRKIYSDTAKCLQQQTEKSAEVLSETKPSRAEAILNVASTERVAHEAVLSAFLLEVRLTSPIQISSFARMLQRNVSGSRDLAYSRVRKMCLLQDASPISEQVRAGKQASSLFDSVAETKVFEKNLGRLDLSPFRSLKRLHIQGSPGMLARQRTSTGAAQIRERRMVHVRENLEELICTLNLWGNGDAFESLWGLEQDPSGSPVRLVSTAIPRSPAPSAFPHLTRLQLHGPRMRFTPQTALALGHLPSLQHLALVLPRFFMEGQIDSPVTFEDQQVVSRDATGSVSALQILINVALRLEELQIIGHDEEGWNGRVGHLSHRIAALKRTPYKVASTAPLQLHLITLTRTSGSERTHPTWYSRTMFALAYHDQHWNLPCARSGGENKVMHDWAVARTVESVDIPTQENLPSRDPPSAGQSSYMSTATITPAATIYAAAAPADSTSDSDYAFSEVY